MFSYFGRKGRAAKTYPAPEYPIVIEPFAGSLAYSLHHRPAQAIGIERDKRTHDLWHRLVGMTEQEIRDFPMPPLGQRTRDRWVIEAARSNGNAATTWRSVSPFMIPKFEQQRALALKHHAYARASVLYSLGDYRQAPDITATWYIDPPYQQVPLGYRHGPDTLDYDELAAWCLTRKGQVIVCEGPGSTWLPFQAHERWQANARASAPIVEKILTVNTHKRCEICATHFPARSRKARYCSARCRQRASRAARSSA